MGRDDRFSLFEAEQLLQRLIPRVPPPKPEQAVSMQELLQVLLALVQAHNRMDGALDHIAKRLAVLVKESGTNEYRNPDPD